jgi:glycosyltransferase involved in cell wall biosynthesis
MTLTVVHVETGRHLYGGALQVYYLLRGLREAGCRNVLVCPAGSAIAEAAPEIVDRLYAVPLGGDLDLRLVGQLLKVMRAERPDLIHLHSRRGADVLGGISGRLAQVPVVLTRRVDNPEPRWLAAWKYRLYDRVIAISAGIQQVLVAQGVPAAKLTCIPSAVDTERFRPGCERDRFSALFGLSADERVVGMVAQLIERKGHRHLLKAIPKILERYPRVRFLLFGQGPLEQEIRAQVGRAGLEGQVRLVGFREDLERMLPCLDLLVHPAEREGLGVSLLQAAACEVPIVASAVGGIPEVVRQGLNGYLVPPADPDAIAQAVLQLLQAPERARAMGQAGRALVDAEFSIAAMVRGNLRVYQRLVGSG